MPQHYSFIELYKFTFICIALRHFDYKHRLQRALIDSEIHCVILEALGVKGVVLVPNGDDVPC
jgi:hypothetical protein